MCPSILLSCIREGLNLAHRKGFAAVELCVNSDKCLDALPNLRCITGGGLQEFDVCPTELSRLISDDIKGAFWFCFFIIDYLSH